MMGPAATILAFTLPAVAVAAAGGALAARWPPGQRTTAAIQHLAAGIVFAATALELLPKERTEAALPVILGFAVGIVLMLALRTFASAMEKRQEARRFPGGLVLVTGIDMLIDGLVLGIAFAAGERAGVLLAVALTLEVLFLAVSVSAALVNAGVARTTATAVPTGLCLLLAGGALVGRLLLGNLPPFPFAILLGIGIVALLYLVTEELLVEAHEVAETPWSIAAFFIGFLAFLVIEMVLET